jgi:hypothetical protein
MSTKLRSILANDFDFRLQLDSAPNARAAEHYRNFEFRSHSVCSAKYSAKRSQVEKVLALC